MLLAHKYKTVNEFCIRVKEYKAGISTTPEYMCFWKTSLFAKWCTKNMAYGKNKFEVDHWKPMQLYKQHISKELRAPPSKTIVGKLGRQLSMTGDCLGGNQKYRKPWDETSGFLALRQSRIEMGLGWIALMLRWAQEEVSSATSTRPP